MAAPHANADVRRDDGRGSTTDDVERKNRYLDDQRGIQERICRGICPAPGNGLHLWIPQLHPEG